MSTPSPDIQRYDHAPNHVAIIMDGNGRWAQQRGMPRQAGHRAGVKSARRLVELLVERGVPHLTLFAFSSENWQRPREEVGALMRLFTEVLKRETAELHKNSVRLTFIGDRSNLGDRLSTRIAEAEMLTRDNQRLRLNVAMAYGGRWDLVEAARNLASAVAEGTLDPDAIDEAAIGRHLSTAGCPDPDLLIRTGGEYRISNFLLWQLAYAEIHFSETLWPDFSSEDIDEAFEFFAVRQRRFGQTREQLEAKRC